MSKHHFTQSFMAKVRREKTRLESGRPQRVDPVERTQSKLQEIRERDQQPTRPIDTSSGT